MSRELPRTPDESLDSIASALWELVEATKKKQTLVPLVIFVPNDMHADQFQRMSAWISDELRKAGLLPPTPQ